MEKIWKTDVQNCETVLREPGDRFRWASSVVCKIFIGTVVLGRFINYQKYNLNR